MQPGLLVADAQGYFHLHTADLGGCWHYDDPCDGTCALPGPRVRAYRATNAFGPAVVRARQLGYEDAKREW